MSWDDRTDTAAGDRPRAGRALRTCIIVSLLLACAIWEAHYQGRPVLPLLVTPYNGHLNVLPRFLFYGLGLITHWNVRIEVLVSFLLVVCTAAVLLLMLRDSGEELLLLAVPVTAVVFSFSQFENFLSGYPLGQLLSQLAATLTVFLLTRPRLTALHVAAGAAAAVVATFSWGAGLMAWPVGLAAVGFRLWRRPWLPAAWGVLMLACALLVKRGAVGAGAVGLAALRTLDIPFCLALLGKPMEPHAFPEFAAAGRMGLLLLAAFFAVLGVTLGARRWLLALRWGLLAALTLGGAVLITLARSKTGPGQALASHYVTACYPLALALLVLASQMVLGWGGGPPAPSAPSAAGPRLRRVVTALLVTALACLPLVSVAVQSRETFLTVGSWVGSSNANDRKLLAGTITDDEIRSSLHPDVPLVRRGIALLREHRLALFADPRAAL
jgi:hypothetical protein